MTRSLRFLAALAATLPAGALAQTVTVGATGDVATLADAVLAIEADPSGPDIIEFLGSTTHLVDGGVTINGDANASPLTLRGEAGQRPILLIKTTGAGIRFNKTGDTTVTNLTFIPAQPDAGTYGSQPLRPLYFAPGTGAAAGVNYVIDDVLITSNNGSDEPLTTDGINVPAFTGGEYTFRVECIRVDSLNPANVNTMSITDTIISAVGSGDGFRSFFDGAEGSGILVGEGVVISHLQALNSSSGAADGYSASAGALQVGGNEGAIQLLTVRGTAANPIILANNNRYGIFTSGTNLPGSVKEFEHVIFAGNLSGGIGIGDADENYILNNVTIANNGGPAILVPAAWTGTIAARNAIIAGNGTSDPNNVVRVASTAGVPGTAVLTDSAIVTAGPLTLLGDGFDPAAPTNVSYAGATLNSDPEFLAYEITSPDFLRAGASAYSTAQIDGAYGTGPTSSSVSDWLMID